MTDLSQIPDFYLDFAWDLALKTDCGEALILSDLAAREYEPDLMIFTLHSVALALRTGLDQFHPSIPTEIRDRHLELTRRTA